MKATDFETVIATTGTKLDFNPDDYLLIVNDGKPLLPIFESTRGVPAELKDARNTFIFNLFGAYKTASFFWDFAQHTSHLAQQLMWISSTADRLEAEKKHSSDKDLILEAIKRHEKRQEIGWFKDFLANDREIIARLEGGK